MCTEFRIIPIDQAQQEAEAHPDKSGFIGYWRTNQGQVRKTGWVATCECKKYECWRQTKREAQEQVDRLLKKFLDADFYISDVVKDPELQRILPDISVNITYGEDGTPVIWIGTENLPEDASGPIVRIYLNDDAIYENPPYSQYEEENE